MPGKLIYVMGPSGAGKDSLIDVARPMLQAADVVVARRIITRSAESIGELAEGLSPAAFAERVRQGGFALHWQANGLSYGISTDLQTHLDAGQHVLVNGSRAYLATARQRYPGLIPLLVTVDSTVLRERLLKRGRESITEIERRLERTARLSAEQGEASERGGETPQAGYNAIETLDNSGSLESSAAQLMTMLQRHGISATVGRT